MHLTERAGLWADLLNRLLKLAYWVLKLRLNLWYPPRCYPLRKRAQNTRFLPLHLARVAAFLEHLHKNRKISKRYQEIYMSLCQSTNALLRAWKLTPTDATRSAYSNQKQISLTNWFTYWFSVCHLWLLCQSKLMMSFNFELVLLR